MMPPGPGAMPPGPGAMPPGPGGAPGAQPPPPGGQPQPMPPGAPGAPAGAMPPTAPMSDAPPPPLPINPRPSQPSPRTSGQAMQEANILGLQEMKNSPGGGTEDLNDQAMAMGAKMAGFDWLGLGHQARRWDDNVPAMQGAGARFNRDAAFFSFGSIPPPPILPMRPNSAAQPSAPQPGLANTQGIQQAMAKVFWDCGPHFDWLSRPINGILAAIKSAELPVGHSSALGGASSQTT
jgi:hypothetical protein